MQKFELFTVLIFAVWRACIFVATDTGPWKLCQRFREMVYRSYGDSSWVFEGITCPWCLSWWFGLIAAVYLAGWGILTWGEVPIWWWGLSGAAILVNEIAKKVMR